MPNVFHDNNAQNIADVSLRLLEAPLRLARVVTVLGSRQYAQGHGATVHVPVPGALVAHARTLSTSERVVVDNLAEQTVPVDLDEHAYSAVELTDADLSLEIGDFAAQVLTPQTDAVAERVEHLIAGVLNAAQLEAVTYDAAAPLTVFTAARRALRDRGVDVENENLVAVVGGDVVDDLLDSGVLDADKAGNADALRDGVVGRLRGFDVVTSSRVPATAVYAFPRTAIVAAVRAPEKPEGATYGAKSSVPDSNLEVRFLRDYAPDTLTDRSVVSTFVGVKRMPFKKVTTAHDTKRQGESGYVAGAATLEDVPGGALVALSTVPVTP